ncbi:MAG: nicotinate (nicotinamide) nucleotide adenylyltransferase [Candidatus Nanopelagicaceae bacterium]|nr:nicotinate (nicotinamide) nucleotide adenylyltransferase [Candidatus Nanopelagicaceae bacterium]
MIKIKNCALFGGTFDPFHNGHLHLIKSLLATRRFDNLVVIPAGDPYQKSGSAPASDRLAMAKLALQGEAVRISDCEVQRLGPSYAIDTVKEIKDLIPADRYTWVIGSDAFAGLPSWERFEELTSIVDFLVILRPGSSEVLSIPGVIFQLLEIGAPEISATELRNRLHRGEDVGAFLPAGVLSYIKEKHLYGAA